LLLRLRLLLLGRLWLLLLRHRRRDVSRLHLPHQVQQPPKPAGTATKGASAMMCCLCLPYLLLSRALRWRNNTALLEQRWPLRLDCPDA
jgi:hypothetical protein